MRSSVAEAWAAFAGRTALGDLPDDVVRQARGVVLDYLGVAIGGVAEPAARIIAGYYADAGGAAEVTAIGCPARLPAASAATVNAATGHALDLDDGNRVAAGHPGVVVVPAALAAAELSGCSGADLVRAIVLGYEVFGRLGATLNPAHLHRGFHTTATAGAVAAAMAASVALGQDDQTRASALSLSVLQGAGLLEVLADGSGAKPMQVGRACGAGVLAAQLAGRGLRGPARAIEGDAGMLTAMADGDGHEALTSDLGADWQIRRTYVKLHAACRHTHPPIDAILAMRDSGLTPDAVDRITVDTYAVAERLCGGPSDPAGPSEARFSIPFAIALALRDGDAGAHAFTAQATNDPGLRSLAARVRVQVDPELEALYPQRRGARVAVARMGDAGTEQREVLVPRGEPEDPVSEAEGIAKFESTAVSVGPERRAAVIDAVSRLEQLPAVGDLLAQLG